MPREPSKEDLEDLKKFRALRDMMNTEGWKLYEKLLRAHLEAKRDAALKPISPEILPDQTIRWPDGVTQVLLGEANKGAIIGLRLALELPRGIVTQGEALYESLFGKPSSDEE